MKAEPPGGPSRRPGSALAGDAIAIVQDWVHGEPLSRLLGAGASENRLR